MKRQVSFSGQGLHTGEYSSITLKPNDGRGYIFTFGEKSFPLEIAGFSGDGRGTVLHFPGGRDLGTVEHLMSALRGIDIDDVEVCINEGREAPSLGGNGLSYAQVLTDAGLEEKEEPVLPITLSIPLGVDLEEQGCSIMAFPSQSFRITYIIDYDNAVIGTQMKSVIINPESYLEDVAPARTFALERDLKELKNRGLAMGGNLSNAILVRENDVVTDGGLRYEDEFVRHKILDLLGDLAILGSALCLHIVCIKGGHPLHLKFVRKLARVRRISAERE